VGILEQDDNMPLLFISAFGLGFAFSLAPGVITVESLRRGIARGTRSAFSLQIGSLIGDATWAIIALIGLSFLFQNLVIALIFSFFGCILLLRFAWDSYKASRKAVALDGIAINAKGDFAAGAALSLSNPQNLAFWLGIGGTIISMGVLNPQPAHMATFFAGYMTACVCWCFVFAGLVGYGRKFVNQRFFRWINLGCALLLGYLGVSLLLGTAQMLLAAA
jgi:chemosensory pili system protein ChpE